MLFLYLQMLDTEGERCRFERFYMLHRDLMFRVAMKLLRNETDAEDVVHQAFLSILKHFSKIYEIDCLKTRAYAVIITERKAIDLVRERNRYADGNPEELEAAPLPPPGDGGLTDAIAHLPRRYREALLLRYLHGYSTAELAALWGMKRDSAQKLLWRAKNALQEQLEAIPDE